MEVLVSQQQRELGLREVRVDRGQGQCVECQVPRREPGALRLVGHRDDVAAQQVGPVGVARAAADVGGRVGPGMPLPQPGVDVVVVELLAPQHAGKGLPQHAGPVGRRLHRGWRDAVVERVGLAPPLVECLVEPREGTVKRLGCAAPQAQADGLAAAGRHGQGVVRGRLGSRLSRVHGLVAAVHHEVVDAVLHIRRLVGRAEQPRVVGLVLHEQERRRALAAHLEVRQRFAEHRVGGDGPRSRSRRRGCPGSARAWRCPPSTTRCCGTRASAARGGARRRARDYTR